MCANSTFGYRSVAPPASFMSYLSSAIATIILISLAAKKRPGHAWRP